MADKKTPEELAAEVKAGFETAIDKVKEVAEEALGKAAKGEKLTETTKETADEALLKMNELKGQFEEFEQKMARIGSNPAERAKSIGEQFIDDEQVKSWIADSPTKGKADMKIKATITTTTVDAAGSVGGAIAPQRVPGIPGTATAPHDGTRPAFRPVTCHRLALNMCRKPAFPTMRHRWPKGLQSHPRTFSLI